MSPPGGDNHGGLVLALGHSADGLLSLVEVQIHAHHGLPVGEQGGDGEAHGTGVGVDVGLGDVDFPGVLLSAQIPDPLGGVEVVRGVEVRDDMPGPSTRRVTILPGQRGRGRGA